RVDQDHVARREYLAGIFGSRPDFRLFERLLRPCELAEGNPAGGLIGEAEARTLGVGAQHHREAPTHLAGAGRQTERSQLGPPLRPNVEMAERAAIAVAAVIGDQSLT